MAKMAVLEEALATMALVHSQVEKMSVAIKNKQPTMVFVQAVKRQLTPLTTKLKMQFGMIADQCTAMLLASTRGASEPVRLRTMREHVAQIKVALEIASAQTVIKHAVKDGTPPKGVETQKPATPRASQAVRPATVTPAAVRPSAAKFAGRPSGMLPADATPPMPVPAAESAAPRVSTAVPSTRPSMAVPPASAAGSSGPVAAAASAAASSSPPAAAPVPASEPQEPPRRATMAGRALATDAEARGSRGTSSIELDADGNPVPRRTTSSQPPTG